MQLVNVRNASSVQVINTTVNGGRYDGDHTLLFRVQMVDGELFEFAIAATDAVRLETCIELALDQAYTMADKRTRRKMREVREENPDNYRCP